MGHSQVTILSDSLHLPLITITDSFLGFVVVTYYQQINNLWILKSVVNAEWLYFPENSRACHLLTNTFHSSISVGLNILDLAMTSSILHVKVLAFSLEFFLPSVWFINWNGKLLVLVCNYVLWLELPFPMSSQRIYVEGREL